MSEWKEYKLGECIQLIGGGTPRTSEPKYWNGNIPWLSVVDFNTDKKYVSSTEKSITEEGLSNSSTKMLQKGDIIISARGTIGAMAVLKIPMSFNQSCYGIRNNQSVILQDYLYYLLKDSINGLKQISHGGVFDTITRDTFDSIDILLPPLPEQQRIAGILSSLDDKIELLNRQNATLEAMAETLFRQWFVEGAKEEWKEIKITDLFDIRDGTHDSPKQSQIGKKLITSKHLSKHSIDFENAYYITEFDFDQINKRSKVETGDILFSMIGTIGVVHLELSNKIDYAIKNIGLFKTSQNQLWKYFTILWLTSSLCEEFIFENRIGSTQEYISLGSLRSITFFVQSFDLVKDFNKQVEPLFLSIQSNSNQIRTLSAMRDTLLPKLMCGEVKI